MNPIISPRAYFANIAKFTEAAMEINRIATGNNLLCAVCGDVSSGKHYGILACNGCSGFFKRSVRRKLIYHCQVNSNMCVIDKAHRNQCQACRYKKCLKMGMIKEAVQNERPSRINPHNDIHRERKINSILHPRSSEQTNLISDSINHLDDTISSQILLMIIKWIRNLPTFFNLPIDDQRILLEETWSELFLLSAIQYSISIDDETFLLNRLGEHEKLIKDIFDVFKKLKLDSIELTCLKAIILFRFDIRTLKERDMIEGLQDQAQITLAQFTQIHNPTRFGRLLLTLPLLRSVPSVLIEKTYFPRVSISECLVDMFKNLNKK